MSTAKFEIKTINFFGSEETGSTEWNAKALYTRNGKQHLCLVYVDNFNHRVYVPTFQHSECKVYVGLGEALNTYEFPKHQ